jgi:hypothetical protein
MIEVPLSIVAWVSVVVVQAVIHFCVLAARRERIQQDEDIVLEESLSLATNEGSLDAYDGSSITESFDLPDIGVASDKSMTDFRELSFSGEKMFDDDDVPLNFRELLSQTGSQLAQVSTTTSIRDDVKLLICFSSLLMFFFLLQNKVTLCSVYGARTNKGKGAEGIFCRVS